MNREYRHGCGRNHWPRVVLFGIHALLFSALNEASEEKPASRTVYVDPQIREEFCPDYSVSERRCGRGPDTAYRDLNQASAAVQPGNNVLIRQGTYTESFVPRKSGTPGSPIVFRRYRDEVVQITLEENIAKPAIILNDRHHLILDGLTVDGAWAWAQLWKSTHIRVENSVFRDARDRGSRGGFRMVDSDHNRILNNRFEDGNDNLMLEHSSRNLVQGNQFRNARHTLLVIACSSFNVIRDNVFRNQWQKAGETFDCEGKIHSLYDDTRQIRRLEETRRNVWERNRFLHTRASTRWFKYNALQHAGQYGIVRHNLFVDNQGGGVGLQMYPDEATYNYGNRIYHNTLYRNRCFGILGGSRSTMWRPRNLVINNLLSENHDCHGKVDADIVNHDWIATKMAENYTGRADFVDPGNHDFHLRPGSPAVDAGEFLTQTTDEGSNSKVLIVEDAGYFFDGYGIDGLVGDEIQLAGNTETAVIVSVDDEKNTLHLDRPLYWKSGQGVALRYRGKRPDAGAFELE